MLNETRHLMTAADKVSDDNADEMLAKWITDELAPLATKTILVRFGERLGAFVFMDLSGCRAFTGYRTAELDELVLASTVRNHVLDVSRRLHAMIKPQFIAGIVLLNKHDELEAKRAFMADDLSERGSLDVRTALVAKVFGNTESDDVIKPLTGDADTSLN